MRGGVGDRTLRARRLADLARKEATKAADKAKEKADKLAKNFDMENAKSAKDSQKTLEGWLSSAPKQGYVVRG